MTDATDTVETDTIAQDVQEHDTTPAPESERLVPVGLGVPFKVVPLGFRDPKRAFDLGVRIVFR